MLDKDKHRKVIEWLESHPELLDKLDELRELEQTDPSLDKAELALFELTKTIGASSFARILQSKSEAASDEQLKQSGVRIHGKKN